ncbi:uncharacterized protein TNIN_439281 [Trichonephila inaurata madagascariensis]|uniref:Uncharacterized protein n=1 Tax=Trichonephila inaurata madagascariensis TaxID=2747483 RepID=A0A8X6YCW6_9ARAC|nr:uncharacterized protein TNIN_439281 [Trichonephila inaurata madagascariensis]
MTGIFWRGYRFASYSNISDERLIFMICSAILNISFQLQVMTSASTTNELARKVKTIVNSMVYQISPKNGKLNCILRNRCAQDYNLTLWKIYVINKALIISSFGTLLTYGMLVGTLGKQY